MDYKERFKKVDLGLDYPYGEVVPCHRIIKEIDDPDPESDSDSDSDSDSFFFDEFVNQTFLQRLKQFIYQFLN